MVNSVYCLHGESPFIPSENYHTWIIDKNNYTCVLEHVEDGDVIIDVILKAMRLKPGRVFLPV